MSVVVLAYAALALICGVWEWISWSDPFYSLRQSQWGQWWHWALGLLFVLVYFFVSILLTSFSSWGKALDRMFSRVLTPLSYFQILILAGLSGFVEEWFFRGLLLSQFGLVISSLVFGLCHLIPRPGLWVWSLWSIGMGMILGSIQLATQSLWLCVGIHTLINASLILYLNLRAYRTPEMA